MARHLDEGPAAAAFRHAFRVAPDVADAALAGAGIGVYGWSTPNMDGFELPATDELVVALHLGGSRSVRAVTDQGLSSTHSEPGLVTVLPPGRPVAFHTAGSIRVMTLHVPSQGRLPDTLARLAATPQPIFAMRDGYARSCMETLLKAADGSTRSASHVPRIADVLLRHLGERTVASLPTTLEPLWPQAMLGEVALTEVLQFIDRHLDARLCLDRLASRTGLSRAAFTRGFKAAVGVPAHQFIIWRRVGAAARLLRETSFDLAYIAQETGFCSQSHFTEVFRLLAGVTPSRFRADAAGGTGIATGD